MLPKLCGTASGKARSHHRRRVLLRSHYELLAVAIAQAVCSSEPQSSRRGAPLQVVPVRAVVMLPVRFGAAPCRQLTCSACRTPPVRFLAGLCRPTRMACAATILATAAEHLDTSGQLQRRKTKAKPSWAEMDLVLCSWETGEIFLSLDRSRRFRSADCREKSRCVTAEDLVP